jgi:hypothetical protein
MTVTQRSIKLQQFHSTTLDAQTYLIGEVFYDTDKKSLRVYDGQTFGGYEIARADLANISKTIGAAISDTPPTNHQEGTIWLDTTSEKLYVYNGGAWVQPQFPAFGGGSGGSGTPTTSNINVALTSPTAIIGNAWFDNTTGEFLVYNGTAWIQPGLGGSAGLTPPIGFPTNPSLNYIHTYGTKSWKWNGIYWEFVTTSAGSGTVISSTTGNLAWYAANGAVVQGTGANLSFDGNNLTVGGSITATSFLGNSSTTTKLYTARTINGVSFDGTANISFPVGSGTVSTGTAYALAKYSSATNQVDPTTNLTFDDTTGNLNVTGTVIASGASSRIRFYWPSISALQSTVSAVTYSGAIGYAGTAGRLYVANGTNWIPIANYSDLSNTFTNVTVAGQNNVTATSTNDSLAFVAGTNISITTDSVNKTVTITGTAGAAYAINTGVVNRLAYYAAAGQTLSDTGANLTWSGSTLSITGNVNTTTATISGATTLQQIFEKATIDNTTVVSGVTNFDVNTQAIVWYTISTSNNFTINIRGSSGAGNELNTVMAIGRTVSITAMITTSATPGSLSGITIDGYTNGSNGYSISYKYPKGVTILSTGNASSIDVYSLTILKTADKTFTIIAQRVNYS